jgi:hypothetical protein
MLLTNSRPYPTGRVFALVLVCGGSFVATLTTVARADERACIAASENELSLRKAGKLHDALKELAVCAEPTCSAEVKAECAKRIAEVQAALPTVVFAATDASGSDIGDLTVTLDGATLRDSRSGRAVPVDPGPHTVRFQATGKPGTERTFIFREGEKDRLVSVVLGGAPVPSAPAETPVSDGSWNGRKTLAVVTGVVGVAGVALGSVFGLVARSDWSSSESTCSRVSCPTPGAHAAALSDQESASTSALVSTVAFGVGAASLAGAVVLWLTAPSGGSASGRRGNVEVAPMVTAGSRGFLVRGTF